MGMVARLTLVKVRALLSRITLLRIENATNNSPVFYYCFMQMSTVCVSYILRQSLNDPVVLDSSESQQLALVRSDMVLSLYPTRLALETTDKAGHGVVRTLWLPSLPLLCFPCPGFPLLAKGSTGIDSAMYSQRRPVLALGAWATSTSVHDEVDYILMRIN
jgi:hypothetical protein